jgi:hypothetical protein
VRANPEHSQFFPCGKRVRWLGWSRLTDLAQGYAAVPAGMMSM